MNPERLLLDLIEKHPILLNKGNTSEIKLAKKKAWSAVVAIFKDNGVEATEKQLYKKWINIRARVMEKLRKRSGTGGGPETVLSLSDGKGPVITG